jgi:excisionase family DNA binding protein
MLQSITTKQKLSYFMDQDLYFLTIQEFAKRLRVHPNTVRNAIKEGRINALKLSEGKRSAYRIPISEMERLVIIKNN